MRFLYTQQDLNMRQQRWLELINDYDVSYYREGKDNMVVDVVSRTSHSLAYMIVPRELHRHIERLNREIMQHGELESRLVSLSIQPTIYKEILASQSGDPLLEKMREHIKEGNKGKAEGYTIFEDGSIR